MSKIKILKNKKAFTLVEISIVLLLLSILAVMTVSFSNLVQVYINDTKKEYDFYEEYDKIKEEIIKSISLSDISGKTFVIKESGSSFNLKDLPQSTDSTQYICFKTDIDNTNNINISQGIIGESKKILLNEITSIKFKGVNEKLIKCTVKGEKEEAIFLISLRCGEVEINEQ